MFIKKLKTQKEGKFMETYRNKFFDKDIERDKNIRETVRRKKMNRNEILSKLKIETNENLIGINLYEIITENKLKSIFKSDSTRKPNPKIIKELDCFKHAEIFARFQLSVEKLKEIKESAEWINKTMDWHYKKFNGVKNKETWFQKNPLKAWCLEKYDIPLHQITLRGKIKRLLEKKNLMEKLGINPKTTTYYGWSNERIKSCKKNEEKLNTDIRNNNESKKKPFSDKTNQLKHEQKSSGISDIKKEEVKEAIITLNTPILISLFEEIVKLNENIKKLINLFECFSEKF